MPQKIPFHVVHVSSQDKNYSATELNYHGPLNKGWQSIRFCMYPQDIVFRLESRAHITKIQILSHQYLITTKIEIFVGDIPENEPVNLKNVRYVCLGYISLANNEKTEFRVRELKSVHVDATGMFLKLNFHKNYINKYNLYNQISVAAINIIGDKIQDESVAAQEIDFEESQNQNKELSGFNRPDYISPLDDLAFDMYQDPGVAQLIRKLEKKKQEAVMQERYDFAKRIKIGIEKLQKRGEKLGKLQVEKRQAVENEDYDKAQQKKIEIFELRVRLYEEVRIKSLLELPQTESKDLLASELFQESEPFSQKENEEESLSENLLSQLSVSGSTNPQRQPSIPIPAHSEYDERPLPVTKKTKPFPTLIEEQPNESNEEPEESKTPAENQADIVPLTEKEMREASETISIFGSVLVSKTYSKSYSLREEALQHLSSQIKDHSTNEDSRSVLRALILPIKRGFEDQVQAVFKATQQLVQLVLTSFIPENKIPRSDTIHFIEEILPNLFHRSGYMALRTREEAKRFVLEIAQHPEIKVYNVVPNECVKPFKMSVFPRLARSRAELVEMLYKEIGISINSNTPGMSVEDIMSFCTVACLHHSSEDVRRVAIRIIQVLYEDIGPTIRNYLPNDEKIRKSPLYKQIFDHFDKIDIKNRKSTMKKAEQPLKKPMALPEPVPKDMKNTMEDNTGFSKKEADDQKTTIPKSVGDINIHINFVPKDNNQQSKKRPESKNIKKKQKQIPAPPTEEVIPEADASIDFSCIFCGEKNKSFDEKGLDIHYWKYCPMLKQCTSCKQVVEISMYKKHLLSECESKDNYRACPQCREPIPRKLYDSHVNERSCSVVDENHTLCPLCGRKINPSDDGWKDHLMGTHNGCRNNPRMHLPRGKQQSSTSIRHSSSVYRTKEKRNISRMAAGRHVRGGIV